MNEHTRQDEVKARHRGHTRWQLARSHLRLTRDRLRYIVENWWYHTWWYERNICKGCGVALVAKCCGQCHWCWLNEHEDEFIQVENGCPYGGTRKERKT